jgi:predicted nucleic acid-binding protein
MSPVFGDTFYFLALLSPKDSAHAQAIQFQSEPRLLVTTMWILTEVGDALSAPKDRPAFLKLWQLIHDNQDVEIAPASDEIFREGLALFQSRPDKYWSLTDCISFHVMRERQIVDALTNDHHFQQAGFKALFR